MTTSPLAQIQSGGPDSLLVAPLDSFDRDSLAIAGGKGANLGELARAGFNVPPGFVVTTRAYDLLRNHDGLHSRLAGWLAAMKADDLASVAQVSGRLRAALQGAVYPTGLREQILQAYGRLGGGAVAVRSSATAEDLPGAAFAGQQETILNVIGEQALLDAIQTCWASLWSERAILYRLRQQVDQSAVKLAVVVQCMLPAAAAGVMFTVNPVSGQRDELVIDANPGLGEAVVSGLVTPDHFVLDKRSKRLKQQQIGRREVIVRAKAGGGIEQIQSPEAGPHAPALPPQAIRALFRLGLSIERHYGSPQDIEWAWLDDGTQGGRLAILQARPMTAIPEPVRVADPMRMVIPMLAEMWPDRPYPLDITTFTGSVEQAIGDFLVFMLGRSAPDPNQALLEEDGVVVRFRPPQVHPSPSILIAPWRAIWRTRHNDPLRWEADPFLNQVITQARRFDQGNLRDLSWGQNLERLHEILDCVPRAMQLRQRYLPRTLVAMGQLWLWLALAGQRQSFAVLISGVRTKTTETNLALEALAAQIRNSPELKALVSRHESGELNSVLRASAAGKIFMEGLDAFLDRYGHRETAIAISQPAWKDAPEIVLSILKVMAGSQPRPADSYTAWEGRRDALLENSLLGRRWLRKQFLKSLAEARCLIQIREDTHFYAMLFQPPARHVAMELGRRLTQLKALDEPEEVFHLRLPELETVGRSWPPAAEAIAEVRALMARRKGRRESLATTPMIDPHLLQSILPRRAGADVLLSGAPGSPGLAGGPARIVHDSSEFGRLRPGDVLVAPLTNPAWTPLFQHAAAVVVDTGGAASHAAIVAREYGVPAVMGTLDGTRRLTDGQRIQVDGTRGLVLKAEEEK